MICSFTDRQRINIIRTYLLYLYYVYQSLRCEMVGFTNSQNKPSITNSIPTNNRAADWIVEQMS